MELYGCMIVFNEIEYLPYSLPDLYDICDHLIIIESCTPWYREWANKDGLSIDGTTEWIHSFPDPKNRLTYIGLGEVSSLAVSRNCYLEHVPQDALFLVIDADEFIFPEDVLQARQYLENHTNYNGIIGNIRNFWGTFESCFHFPKHFCAARMMSRSFAHQYGPGTTAQGNNDWRCPDQLDNQTGWWENFYYMEPPFRLLHAQNVRHYSRLVQKVLGMSMEELSHGIGSLYHNFQGLTPSEFRVELLLNHYYLTRQLPPPLQEALIHYPGPWPRGMIQHPYATMDTDAIFDTQGYSILVQQEIEKLYE